MISATLPDESIALKYNKKTKYFLTQQDINFKKTIYNVTICQKIRTKVNEILRSKVANQRKDNYLTKERNA